MSNLKFVPLAIIAIMSVTAVSQARAEEPLAAGSSRIYSYLAGHPDRDAYTGKLTPAAKLEAEAQNGNSRFNAFAQAPAASSQPRVVGYSDPSQSGGQPR